MHRVSPDWTVSDHRAPWWHRDDWLRSWDGHTNTSDTDTVTHPTNSRGYSSCCQRHFTSCPSYDAWRYLTDCRNEKQLLNTRSPGWADRIAYIRRAASDFWSLKETDFLEALRYHTRYGDAAIPDATVTLGYDTVIRRTWVMAACSNFTFTIAVKQLQTETWLLLTAYTNLSSPYSTVPSPTLYVVRFSLVHKAGCMPL